MCVGTGILYASNKMKNDRQIVMAAILTDDSNSRKKFSGSVLQYRYTSDEMKGNFEIVMVAVKQRGQALKYTPNEMKKDRQVVISAVLTGGSNLEYDCLGSVLYCNIRF